MKIDMSLDTDVDQDIDSGMGMDMHMNMNKNTQIYRFKNLDFDQINRLMAPGLRISIFDPFTAPKFLSPEENLSILCIKFKKSR
jgi:hypothetical protein